MLSPKLKPKPRWKSFNCFSHFYSTPLHELYINARIINYAIPHKLRNMINKQFKLVQNIVSVQKYNIQLQQLKIA